MKTLCAHEHFVTSMGKKKTKSLILIDQFRYLTLSRGGATPFSLDGGGAYSCKDAPVCPPAARAASWRVAGSSARRGRRAREVFPGPPLLSASPAFSADQGSGTLLRSLSANFSLAESLKGSTLKSCFNQRGYRCELLMWWILKRCAQNKGPLFEIVGEGKKRDSFFYSHRKNFVTKKIVPLSCQNSVLFPRHSALCSFKAQWDWISLHRSAWNGFDVFAFLMWCLSNNCACCFFIPSPQTKSDTVTAAILNQWGELDLLRKRWSSRDPVLAACPWTHLTEFHWCLTEF